MDLERHQKDGSHASQDIASLSPNELKVAKSRYQIIRSLVEGNRTDDDVQNKAQEVGVTGRTLYRWIRRFERGGLADLAPRFRDRGMPPKFSPILQKLIETILEDYFFGQTNTVYACWKIFRDRCLKLGYSPGEIISYKSFYNRYRTYQDKRRENKT